MDPLDVPPHDGSDRVDDPGAAPTGAAPLVAAPASAAQPRWMSWSLIVVGVVGLIVAVRLAIG